MINSRNSIFIVYPYIGALRCQNNYKFLLNLQLPISIMFHQYYGYMCLPILSCLFESCLRNIMFDVRFA